MHSDVKVMKRQIVAHPIRFVQLQSQAGALVNVNPVNASQPNANPTIICIINHVKLIQTQIAETMAIIVIISAAGEKVHVSMELAS